MKRSKYNSFNELPLMLTVQDVADVLGIGLAHAYEVAHRQDFRTITLGSRIISPVISSWSGSMSRRPKRRKYFSGYFKDSVVFVCVAISARRRNACEQPSEARRLASRKGGQRNEQMARAASGKSPTAAGRADTHRASTPAPAALFRKACPPGRRPSVRKSWRKPSGTTGASR